MPSGMGLPAVEQAGVTSAAGNPLPGTFREFELNLQSDRLYDLDSDIPDVIGLCVMQPDAAVIKVMSTPDNCCIRVVIPDDHLGTDGFHEILIHDMEEEDPPIVALSNLRCLRLDWPRAIFSFMDVTKWTSNICTMHAGNVSDLPNLACEHSVASIFSKIWADMLPVITWI